MPHYGQPMSDEVLFFDGPAAFRAWLEEHHAAVDVQWVGYWKVHTGKPSMSWQESVDEALCYGWIDGLRRSIDEEAYKIRFTPRREGSVWSAKNVASAKELIAAGRIQPPGLAAYEKRVADKTSIYSYEQDEVPQLADEYEKLFRDHGAAWSYYSEKAPGYRKRTAHWVMSAKQEKTRRRRLRKLIDYSAKGESIPEMVSKK